MQLIELSGNAVQSMPSQDFSPKGLPITPGFGVDLVAYAKQLHTPMSVADLNDIVQDNRSMNSMPDGAKAVMQHAKAVQESSLHHMVSPNHHVHQLMQGDMGNQAVDHPEQNPEVSPSLH